MGTANEFDRSVPRNLTPAERVQAKWDRLTPAQRHAAREVLALRPAHIRPFVWLAMSEADRRAVMLAVSHPDACGPEIPRAPARRAMQAVTVKLIDRVTGAEERITGHAGRKAGWEDDVFDRMRRTALRARKAMPLTDVQIATGRHYRAMVERYQAGAVKLSSFEGGGGGGGHGVDIMDLRLEEARLLAGMRKEIGAGAAMVVRRVRPSQRGTQGASIILDRTLVDMVCVQDQDLSAILEAHGWGTWTGSLDRLRDALSASLERMSMFLPEYVKKGG